MFAPGRAEIEDTQNGRKVYTSECGGEGDLRGFCMRFGESVRNRDLDKQGCKDKGCVFKAHFVIYVTLCASFIRFDEPRAEEGDKFVNHETSGLLPALAK